MAPRSRRATRKRTALTPAMAQEKREKEAARAAREDDLVQKIFGTLEKTDKVTSLTRAEGFQKVHETLQKHFPSCEPSNNYFIRRAVKVGNQKQYVFVPAGDPANNEEWGRLQNEKRRNSSDVSALKFDPKNESEGESDVESETERAVAEIADDNLIAEMDHSPILINDVFMGAPYDPAELAEIQNIGNVTWENQQQPSSSSSKSPQWYEDAFFGLSHHPINECPEIVSGRSNVPCRYCFREVGDLDRL